MDEQTYTIDGRKNSRQELLEFGKAHYPKLYWVKRGVGIGLIVAALSTTIVAFVLPIYGFVDTLFIILMISAGVVALTGLIFIFLSFRPLSDEKYIKYAETYYKKLMIKKERRSKTEELKDINLLIKYKELLDKGIITQEEFDIKKEELFR